MFLLSEGNLFNSGALRWFGVDSQWSDGEGGFLVGKLLEIGFRLDYLLWLDDFVLATAFFSLGMVDWTAPLSFVDPFWPPLPLFRSELRVLLFSRDGGLTLLSTDMSGLFRILVVFLRCFTLKGLLKDWCANFWESMINLNLISVICRFELRWHSLVWWWTQLLHLPLTTFRYLISFLLFVRMYYILFGN